MVSKNEAIFSLSSFASRNFLGFFGGQSNFLSIISVAYQLQPLDSGALLRAYPQDWALFRADLDGYRLVSTFKTRPDVEAINAALLDSRNNLIRQVTEIDRFLEGLRH